MLFWDPFFFPLFCSSPIYRHEHPPQWTYFPEAAKAIPRHRHSPAGTNMLLRAAPQSIFHYQKDSNPPRESRVTYFSPAQNWSKETAFQRLFCSWTGWALRWQENSRLEGSSPSFLIYVLRSFAFLFYVYLHFHHIGWNTDHLSWMQNLLAQWCHPGRGESGKNSNCS